MPTKAPSPFAQDQSEHLHIMQEKTIKAIATFRDRAVTTRSPA